MDEVGHRSCAGSGFLWLFLLAVPAVAQPLRIGVKAGVPLTDFFVPGAGGSRICACFVQYSSVPMRYTVGPAVEVGLPFRFAAELDVLYKRFHYSWVGASGFVPRTAAAGLTTGNAWEIPLLLKRRFGLAAVHPYLLGGPVVRHVSGLHQASNEVIRDFNGNLTFRRVESGQPSELGKRWYPGVSAGGGVELRLAPVRISPEVRYTRWTANSAPTFGLYFYGNQVEVMVGVGF